MKKTVLLIVTLAIISCSNTQKTKFSEEALSAKLLTTDHGQIPFSTIVKKHKGKTLLIEVWASWCGDCVKAMPKIQELQANNPNIDYMFISMDKTDNQWKEGIAKYDLKGEHFSARLDFSLMQFVQAWNEVGRLEKKYPNVMQIM